MKLVQEFIKNKFAIIKGRLALLLADFYNFIYLYEDKYIQIF